MTSREQLHINRLALDVGERRRQLRSQWLRLG